MKESANDACVTGKKKTKKEGVHHINVRNKLFLHFVKLFSAIAFKYFREFNKSLKNMDEMKSSMLELLSKRKPLKNLLQKLYAIKIHSNLYSFKQNFG